MNMKATDLMIGDWVKMPSGLPEIRQIEYPFEIDDADFYEPIPLTSEILEKNGFRNSLDEWHLFKGCLQTNFTLKSYDDTNEVLLPLFNGNMQIIYVHELQHALKLCGIKKEIKL